MNVRGDQIGMTLLETMIGLAVAGIVVMIIASSFDSVRLFAARVTTRGESDRLASEIIQLTRSRIITREKDGLQLTDQFGVDFRQIEIDRMVNDKAEETFVSTTCEKGPAGVTLPTVCGITCQAGKRPVTTITTEKTGGGSFKLTYPPLAADGTSWIGNDALGVVVCARKTVDAVSLRATVFFMSGKNIRSIARQANLPMNHFVIEEATLVP